MGGGSYRGDVSDRGSTNMTNFRQRDPESRKPEKHVLHPDCNIKGKDRECCDSAEHPETTPIVVALDVTSSRGQDVVDFYKKLPMFFGEMVQRRYVDHPSICYTAIGDATDNDRAPLQVAQFEADNRLDKVLTDQLWIELGGGGSGFESYELAAYYLAHHTNLDANKRGQKGILFFIGDERFYPAISKEQVKRIIGDDLKQDMPSVEAFRQLQQKYQVFFLYPQQSAEKRRAGIDAEIKKRLDEAHGMYKNVDLRCSLMWNTFDDLDLHCITPKGEEIFFSQKVASCGGNLDVDRNAGHQETRKPVENIRWEKGKARRGKYKFFVRNYAYHEDTRGPIEFTVELENNGKIEHFDGKISLNHETGSRSDVVVFEVDYDPSERIVDEETKNIYEAYGDEGIIGQWQSVLPPENVLIFNEPKAAVDIQLGVLALIKGVSLEEYVSHMVARGQTQTRCTQVQDCLSALAQTMQASTVSANLPPRHGGRTRRTKRLE
jgi:hypothetical protein